MGITASADRAITSAVLDAWLDAACTIGDFEPVAQLLDRVVRIGERHWDIDANFNAYSGVDRLTRAINDWTGKSAMVWMKLPQSVASDDASRFSSVLEAMQDGITRMLSLDGDLGHLTIAVVGNRLNLLFALAPDWSVAAVLPLFDATVSIERALCAWNGYLYSNSGNQQPLKAGLLEHYLTLTRLPEVTAPLDPHSDRRNGPTDFQSDVNRHLAEISLFSGINPQEHGWLASYTSGAPLEWRTTWARNLSSGLSAVTIAARTAQWQYWIRDHLKARTAGRLLTLDPAEASELAEWSRHFDAEFPEFVEIILTWPQVPLRERSRLMYSMSKLRNEPGDDADTKVDVAARHPDEAAKLLAHLLSASDRQRLHQDANAHFVRRAAARLRDRAASTAWQELEHQLLRLGIRPAPPSS